MKICIRLKYCFVIFLICCSSKLHGQNAILTAGLAYSGFSKTDKYYYKCPDLLISGGVKFFADKGKHHRLGAEVFYGQNKILYLWPGEGTYNLKRTFHSVNAAWDIVVNPLNKFKMVLGIAPTYIARQKNTIITNNQYLNDGLVNTWSQPGRFLINYKPELSIQISEHSLICLSTLLNLSKTVNSTYRLNVAYGFMF